MVESLLIDLNGKLQSAEAHIANQEASLEAAKDSLGTRVATLEEGYATLSDMVTSLRPNPYGA